MAARSKRGLIDELNEARRQRSLSIRATARLIDVPAATVQGWLSGKHWPTPALVPQFERLLRALDIDPGDDWLSAPDADPTLCPFLGLRPYSERDESFFFGRDDALRRLREAISRNAAPHGIVVLTGPSGSGKSSLLAAGLVGRAPSDAHQGRPVYLLARSLPEQRPDAPLIVVDQLEAILDAPRTEVAAAVTTIAEWSRHATVVLGLRADQFGAFSTFPELQDALERTVLLQPMNADELRSVIEGPARAAGLTLEGGLADLILAEILSGPRPPAHDAILPLLSHALLATWEMGDGRTMTAADYRRAGGVTGAVEEMTERVWNDLTVDERKRARALFLSLIKLVDDRVERRPVPLDEFSPEDHAVAEIFIQSRILTASETHLQISHDAILHLWPRMSEWVQGNQHLLELKQRIGSAALLWRDNDRSVDSLLPVDRLPLFVNRLEENETALSSLETEFVEASRAHFTSVLDEERHVARRLKSRGRFASILAAVAVVLALVAGGALVDSRRVHREAQSRQVATLAGRIRSNDANLRAQMALTSYRIATTSEARSALLDATSVRVPTRWVRPGSSWVATAASGDLTARADGVGEVEVWRDGVPDAPADVRFAAAPDTQPLFAVATHRTPSQALVAVGGAGGQWSLWDVSGTPTTLTRQDGPGTVFALTFTADGRRLAVGRSDGQSSTIELWSVEDATQARKLAATTLDGQVSALVFDAPATRLFVAGVTDGVLVLTPTASSLEKSPDTLFRLSPSSRRSLSLALSPDGRLLAAGASDGTVVTWHVDSYTRLLAQAQVSDLWVNGLAFSPDSTRLLTGDSQQLVSERDAESLGALRTWPAPTLVQSVAYAGDRPAATGVDGTLWLWEATSPVLRQHGAPIYYLAGDVKGQHWAAGVARTDKVLQVWDLSGDRPVTLPPLATPEGVRVSEGVSSDDAGRTLVAGTRVGQVVAWPVDGTKVGTPTVSQIGDADSIIIVADISPDGQMVAAAEYGGQRTFLAKREGGGFKQVGWLPTQTPQMVSFSPDGTLLQVGIAAEGVELWDVRDPSAPQRLSTLQTPDTPGASTFSPDGRLVAAGTDSGLVMLWDVTDAKNPASRGVLRGPRASVTSLTFRHDGGMLVAASNSDGIWGWDTTHEKPEPLFTLGTDSSEWNAVRVVADGRLLMASAGDGQVRTWTLDPVEAHEALCSRLGDHLNADEWNRYLNDIQPFDPCAR